MRPCSPGPSCGSSLARRLVSAVVTTAVLCAASTAAHAQTVRARDTSDVLVIPFLAATVGGHTNLVDLEQAAGEPKTTFGGSVAWLGDGLLGLEADVHHAPHFFERTTRGLIASSNVSTLTGNVVIAVPRWITRESLRPYLVAGVGLLHAHLEDRGKVFNTTSNLLGLDVGGGVIGLVYPRAGARFELRHVKNISKDDAAVTFGSTRLSFWRLSAGLVLRY